MEPLFTIFKYHPDHRALWNTFIASAKNATFLHHRSFMEYHSERFEDYSLMVKKGSKVIAVLPANISNRELYSHQGLTYAGLLLSPTIKLTETILVFKGLLAYLEKEHISYLYIKQVPSFYTQQPSEELEYLFYLTEAELYRVDTASVIDFKKKSPIQSNRLEGVKKAQRAGLSIREEPNFKDFWSLILEPNLRQKHNSQPTHTLGEIQLLQGRFPENIRHFNVFKNQEIVGGATIFDTKTVAHVQYISAGPNKQELGTLDFLFYTLLGHSEDFWDNEKRFFDFGISNMDQGRHLNKGLSYWKESFGARTYVHKFYRVSTKNHPLLNDVLI